MGGSSTPPVPIAVIGMAFHLSGGLKDDDSFWKLLLEGRSTSSRVPKDRFSVDQFYHPDTNRLDTLPNTKGYFIQDDIASFDAPFFAITPAEAAAMDPQSRALLELSYQALENAGIPLENCTGSNTSVYIGCSADDYRLTYAKDPERPIRHAATGMARSMLANKISWYYNLHGPSLTIDTACSSSLNAVHLACQSLRTGESTMALVGGSQLFFTPDSMAPLAHLNFFSPDGECFSFDKRANGYSRGEGHGMLVLKPLADALRDKDRIRAVIRATGSDENGRTPGGITKVNVEAQARLIRKTYASAGLDLAQTRFVEAHGPGTGGDIIECAGLASVFSQFRTTEKPLYVSSVKANLGHLEGGSGIPSLVKTILSLERGVIPMLANFHELHPDIAAENYPFSFLTHNVPWPDGLRRASINSFGFGGSNAHVVLEDSLSHIAEALQATLPRHITPSPSVFQSSLGLEDGKCLADFHILGQRSDPQLLTQPRVLEQSQSPRSWLLPFSSADERGIERLSKAFRAQLQEQDKHRSPSAATFLRNLSYTLSQRRTHLPWRTFTVASSWPDVGHLLTTLPGVTRAIADPKIAFIFTGQGAQWPQMGISLMCYPTFGDVLERCQNVFRELGANWNLFEELERPLHKSRIYIPEFSQPLCIAIQIALVDLLESFGVKPQAVVGHSSGEIAAAYCAGAISQYEACKLAFFRGVVCQKLHDAEGEDVCGMMVADLDRENAMTYIEGLAQIFDPVKVYLACINAPSSVTFAGSKGQLSQLEETLKAKSIFSRLLHVSVAYHSPYMLLVASDYKEFSNNLDTETGACKATSPRFYSSLHGKYVDNKQLRDKNYWVDNLTCPVLFFDAVKALFSAASKSRFHALVEIGPHGVLQVPIEETLRKIPGSPIPLYRSALDRKSDDQVQFLNLIGSLHCLGVSMKLNAERCYEGATLFQDLPSYPFDHSRTYWHESRLSKNFRHRKFPRSDFLGTRVSDWNPHNARWRHTFRTLENPWIEDHRIGGVLLLPGAGSLVMAIEAASQYVCEFDDTPLRGFKLRDVSFLKSLNISSRVEGTETQISLRPLKDKGDRRTTWMAFNVYLYENDEWAEVCNGQICLDFEEPINPVDGQAEVQHQIQREQDRYHTLLDRCPRQIEIDHLYQRLHDYGLELGPSFKAFTNVRGNMMREAIVDIALKQWACRNPVDQTSPYHVHPATLDNILQAGVTALSNCGADDIPTMVPSRIRYMWISAKGLDGSVDSHITACANSEYRGYRETDMHVLALSTTDHIPVIRVDGLETIIIGSQETKDSREQKLCCTLRWEELIGPEISSSMPVAGNCPPVRIITQPGSERDEMTSRIRKAITDQAIRPATVSTLAQASAKASCPDEVVLFMLEFEQKFFEGMDQKDFDTLKSILLNARHVLWICHRSASSQRVSGEIDGLARALRSEYENLKLVTLHCEPSIVLTKHIINAILQNIADNGTLHPSHRYEPEQLVKQNGALYVSRLEEDSFMNRVLDQHKKPIVKQIQPFGAVPNLKLGIGVPGALDTLQFEQDDRPLRDLPPDEIEVEPIYGGLNFMDCLTALGQIPQDVLGVECSGIVRRAGEKSDLRPGTRVMLCTDGTFGSRTRCHYKNAIRIPDEMPMDVAAGLLGSGGTAYHALCNVARLQAGESILIHAGAGATGQMAVQVALYIGADVYVTVGSREKSEYVRNAFGIVEDHILYSRNTGFAEAIKRLTHGRGVDVVLNSLAGDSLIASWECIAPFGRFVEIGKKDIYSHKHLSMFPFAKNVSFSAVDLAGIWQERSWLMREIGEGLLNLWATKRVAVPHPLTTFDIDKVEDAFRLMQSGRGMGKILLHLNAESLVNTYLPRQPTYMHCPDATYLISGGLSGLGAIAAKWMASRGAKHLILLSRSGSTTKEAKELIAELESAGVQVMAPQCDITDGQMLSDCLRACRLSMPPIKGCIQSAMVVRDKLFQDMTFTEWSECLEPKTTGSWNLHTLLPRDMDFFILLSSIGGIVGARGQANYAAGNSFQDALAHHRVSLGLKATALDLGMMRTTGVLAKNPKLLQHLDSLGFYISMTHQHFHALLDHYCNPELEAASENTSSNAQLVCGIATPSLIQSRGKMLPNWMDQPLFEAFRSSDINVNQQHTADGGYRTVLANSATAAEAADVVSKALVLRLARSLGMVEADIDVGRPLHFYAVDSLVAVELRNWYWTALQADVAVFEILGNRGCDSLSLFAVLKSNFRNPAWTDVAN